MVSQSSLLTGRVLEPVGIYNPGGALVAGSLVAISGLNTNIGRLLISPSIGDSDGPVANYVLLQPLASGGVGFAYTEGLVSGLNTSSSSIGAPVYLSPTVEGGWTFTAPTSAGQQVQVVGHVITVGANGSIYFDVSSEAIAIAASSAPTTADYVVGTANASLSAELVLGTAVIMRGTYAARPVASLAGRIYLPTDSPIWARDNGVSWDEYYGSVALVNDTYPAIWDNQGGATVDTTKGGVYLALPTGASVNWRSRVKATPATPYTITIGILPTLIAGTGAVGNAQAGLVLRQSSDGKLVNIAVLNNGALEVQKWTAAGVFSATYVSRNYGFQGGQPMFLRLADDGVNRVSSFSQDGVFWYQIHSVGRTDFMTADQVGFGANVDTSDAAKVWLLSWDES